MSSLSSLEPAFVHCGVHPFLFMLPHRSPFFSSRCGSRSPQLSLPPYNLVIWTDGPVPFLFGKEGFNVLANYSLCGTEATISFYAGSVCSSFSTEACAILQLLSWSRQHQLVCYYYSLSSSPTLALSLPLCLLLDLSFYLKLSGRSGTNRLLYNQATMGPRTLISLWERRGQ